VEFTCTVFSVKLTEIFKVKFCTNYVQFIHIVLNLRKKFYLTYGNPTARKHTHTHTQTHTHTRTHTNTHTHIHTSTNKYTHNTVSVWKGIYLLFHIQFSCCPVKLLFVALVNVHTKQLQSYRYSNTTCCTVHVWHITHIVYWSDCGGRIVRV
jgi:hypothetical protein